MTQGLVDRPRGTGDWLIMYFPVPCQIMSKQVAAGSLMIWSPGESQKYGDRQLGWSHSWMHCDGTAISRWLKQANLRANTIYSGMPQTHWVQTLIQVFDELNQHDVYASQMILNLMQNALLTFGRHAHPAPEDENLKNSLQDIRRQLEMDYDQPVTLDELAAQTGLSISHFCARFKQAFGSSAIEYLIEQRMQQAAYLLYDRNLKIQDIAKRVGYDDVFHFSKLFKKHHGLSPRALRKQQLGD
ncbi:MAG: helix-turn-helix transcriptional regulator [Phycisphaeraceae bacterium JB051]